MQEQLPIKVANYPKMLGQLVHSNQFLKTFSLVAMTVAFIYSILFFGVLGREPTVIALSEDAIELKAGSMPKPENEVKRAISKYVETRYQWEPGNVKDRLEKAKAFIAPHSLKAYETAIANLVQFSTQKIVAQRAYPGEIEISLDKSTAVVLGDRITTIQGLKAAGNLNLELTFESGPRTKENPWGIYITREKEGQ